MFDKLRQLIRVVLLEKIVALPDGKWAVYPKKGGKQAQFDSSQR